MSRPASRDRASGEHDPDQAGGRRPPVGVRAWVAVVAWVVLAAWIGPGVADGWSPRGDLDGLLPTSHRAPRSEVLITVARDPDATDDTNATAGDLLAAADRIHDELGPAWVPIAPPAAEVDGWLDGHALLFLPLSSHGQLRDRLTDAAISSAVEGLRARLSSPLFSLTGEEARRDPLRLRELTAGAAGRFGHVRAGTPAGASVTPNGDLLARDRDALLMELHPETIAGTDDLIARVQNVLGEGTWRVELVGPIRTQREAAAMLASEGGRVAAIALAAIGLVLTVALRRFRATAAILLTLVTGLGCVVLLAPSIDPISFPLLVLLLGFGCEGSLHLQRISQRGWPAALVLGLALVPLLLSPYPEWKSWALWWIGAVAIVMVLFRLVLPALLSVTRGSASWEDRGFVLRAMPALALVLTASVLGFGVWATQSVPYRGADRVELGDSVHPPQQKRLTDSFFDPTLVAEARTVGRDPGDALVRAAGDADALMKLVPRSLVRVDSPGSLVLTDSVLDQRRASLSHLELDARLGKLSTMLETRGFRPAAFGEFLRSAGHDDSAPSAESLLQGPLGRWVRRYLVEDSEGTAVRTFVHLPPDPETPVPVVLDADGAKIELQGPAIAARTDRGKFKDWLGIYMLCQLWIGSVIVWLGTRSFAISISAAFAALVTQTSVLSIMLLLHQPIGPMIVPALLLVGAGAMIAAGRACRAMDLHRPFFAMGLLTTSACQVAAGLALVATDVPAWSQVGLVAAIGAAVASGAGLFVAPGLTRILRAVGGARIVGDSDDTPPVTSQDDEPEPADARPPDEDSMREDEPG